MVVTVVLLVSTCWNLLRCVVVCCGVLQCDRERLWLLLWCCVCLCVALSMDC